MSAELMPLADGSLRVRVVSTRGSALLSAAGRLKALGPGLMTLLLDQPLPGLALDDELFLAVLRGSAGITLVPAVVVSIDAPWVLTVRLADEDVRVQGREYFRVAATWRVAICEAPGGPWRPCQTRDVSAGGVLLDDATPALLGTRHRLALYLPGGQTLTLSARLVRFAADGCRAYEFTSVLPTARALFLREMMAAERRARGCR
jgi:hypothetical protein